MDSLILIVVSTLIFMPYMIYQYCHKGNRENNNYVQLHQAEAGTTKSIFKRKNDLMQLKYVNVEGINMDKNLTYFIVKNQCMKLKGIADGDIIGVKMFDGNFSLSSTKGEILLIYLDDEYFKGFKIREQGDLTLDGMAYGLFIIKTVSKQNLLNHIR